MQEDSERVQSFEIDYPEEYRFGMEGTAWRIFVLSVHLFAESDYSSISMRTIAHYVGIRVSSIYNHYPSKDAILEKMYEYMVYYHKLHLTAFNSLADEIGETPPRELLKKTNAGYPEPLQAIMSKMILICYKQMCVDERADKILNWMLIDFTKDFIVDLLEKMVERGVIKPLDIGAFAELYTNIGYAAALRLYSSRPSDNDVWQRSFNMMFEIIEPT